MSSRRDFLKLSALGTASFAVPGAYSSELTMTYNTGNPVPSKDARDLTDNAESLDIRMTSRVVRSTPDRLGIPRKTWYGIEQDFQEFLLASGYQLSGEYGPGIELTALNQVVSRDGDLWRLGASAPVPYITTGNWTTDSQHFVSVGDAALRADLTEADGARLVGAPGAGTVSQALGMVSVEQYGAADEGMMTAQFQAACQQAVAQGHRRVFIPFQTLEVAQGTDAYGCEIYGADTELTGRLLNHTGLHNVRIMGHNQSDVNNSPSARADRSPKIVWRSADKKRYVCVEKVGSPGYVMIGFGRDATTTDQSLATSNSEPTRERMVEVLNSVWCGTYVGTPSNTSGAWSDSSWSGGTVFANIIPYSTSGRAITAKTTSTADSYVEYQTTPHKGEVTVCCISGTSAPQVAEVSINGAAPVQIRPRAAASNTLKVFRIDAKPYSDTDLITVRVTHKGVNGEALSVVGLHFAELCNWDGHPCDSFAYYRNSAFADYLTRQSANDTVIREYNSNTYGASFHGGETGIVSVWTVDGATLSQSIDGFAVGRSVRLDTSCSVSWAALGGGNVDIASAWHFAAGGVSHEAQITGDITAREMYTCMFGAPESFSEVIYPMRADLSSMPTDTRFPLGRTNRAVIMNPSTRQRIAAEMTIYSREQNQYGGAHFWHAVGSYNKLYYGPCLGGRMRITNLGMLSNFTFD